MSLAARNPPSTSAPGDASRTVTITNSQPRPESEATSGDEDNVIGTLRLRATPRRNSRRVVWDETVVDNEGCGKKSSKICCIYHKPKRFDESSDEDSDSDISDSSDDDGRARPAGYRRRRHHHHHHHHNHSHSHDADGGSSTPSGSTAANDSSGGTIIHELSDNDEPNAYEAGPGSHKGKRKA